MADRKDQVLTALREICDLKDPNNQEGFIRLTEMMQNAWQIKIKQAEPDWTPKDGNPRADNVIWGFVKGATDPLINLDFTLCHGIERVLTQQNEGIEFTDHKDWLLCALTHVVALRGLRSQGVEAKVLDLWSTPRPDGLGWISANTLGAFRQELGLP